MEEFILRYGILAGLAAISGFFVVGFIVYTIYATISWFRKREHLQKIWGGLTGLVLNGLIFIFTFPVVYPVIVDAIDRVLYRFR